MKTRRSAVFVMPNSIVGHELIFRHYTNKVVVGNYTDSERKKASEFSRQLSEKRNQSNKW